MNFKFLFRFLWPSWKFFEDTGWHPELRVVLQSGTQTLTKNNLKLHWWNFFINPQINLELAIQSVLYQSLQLINEDLFENSTEKNLIENIISYKLRPAVGTQVEYQIVVTHSLKQVIEVAYQGTYVS
jgi:hypothetical protein